MVLINKHHSQLKTYNSYHTCIKQLAKRNSIPQTYLKSIDRVTIWRWKQEPMDKYLGTELTNIEILDQFLSRKESETVIRSYLKVANAFSRILSVSDQLHSILKRHKTDFIKTVLKYKSKINLKLILRLCRIPVSVFHYWKHQILKNCVTSPIMLCKKIYPNQLTSREVSVMKQLVADERFRYWPVCSIAYFALRKNILNISLSTWYHYINKLGIAKPVLIKKKAQGPGICANRPHEIWHADIMVMKTLDGIKNYLYFLMDNYSRLIINWRAELRVSGKIRLETIEEAYNKYYTDSDEDIILLVDGGVENNNFEVESFIRSDEINLRKLIAQKDIRFSNSVIEAQNKLIKYRYLFKQDFRDIHDLRKGLEWIVFDYNNNRPHISLRGLTPNEVATGEKVPKDMWYEQIIHAQMNRLAENRKELCSICK
jgi:putative transposase